MYCTFREFNTEGVIETAVAVYQSREHSQECQLRLRPFVISQVRLSVFLQSYSPSNYRKLKTGDRHQKSMLVSDIVYNGERDDRTSDAPSQSS